METQTLPTVINNESLAIYSPKNLQLEFKNVTTVTQALQTGSKSMVALKNEFSTKKVEALIKLQLIELNEILNLKRPLNEKQIDDIAVEIVSQWYYLTMADVYLIFRRAKIGWYGEFYESINMPKILTWFRNYFDERCSEAERQSIERAEQNKYYSNCERISSQLKKDDLVFHVKKLIELEVKKRINSKKKKHK